MIDFPTLQDLTIPEGVVTQINDASDKCIWLANNGKAILEVTKITSDTASGETLYKNESFVLLNICPKDENSVVNVTYGDLTKTIQFEGTNAQSVFFGTFNGVSDSIETPESGRLTIEGDYISFGLAKYQDVAGKVFSPPSCDCVNKIINGGVASIFYTDSFSPNDTLATENPVFILTRVNIPKNAIVENFSFSGNLYLTNVTLGKGAHLFSNSFYNCNIQKIVIPEGVIFDGNPFTKNSDIRFSFSPKNTRYKAEPSLIDLVTNTLVTGVEDNIPFYVENLGNYSFAYNEFLSAHLTIPDNVINIGIGAFYLSSGLSSVEIPDSVTSIGVFAFSDCSSLTSIVIGNGVKNIDSSAFSMCNSLTDVVIGDSVEIIGSHAFKNCDNLKEITLPSTIKSIGDRAFESDETYSFEYDTTYSKGSYLTYLDKVKILATVPPTITIVYDESASCVHGSFGGVTGNNFVIEVPKGCGKIYKSAEGWKEYANNIVEAS